MCYVDAHVNMLFHYCVDVCHWHSSSGLHNTAVCFTRWMYWWRR